MARRLAELTAHLAASREETYDGAAPLDPAVGDDWWADHTRVAQRPALVVVPESDDRHRPPVCAPERPAPAEPPGPWEPPGPPPLPVPGRHAARRTAAWATDLVPATLRGRVRLGAPHVATIAVLVAVGLAVTCWLVVSRDPEPPVPVALQQQAEASPGVPVAPLDATAPEAPEAPELSGAPPTAPAGASVTVDVAGRVRRPGIVVLDVGARVVDALDMAGGARAGVDLTSLNLARLLVDGEQIVVGVEGGATSPPAVTPPVAADGEPPPAAPVDLNLADQALLETLPNVGPVTATAIIAWRTEHGGFSSVTELLEVDGIGDATLAQLTPLVTV